LEEVLPLGVERNLIVSSAHHSAREIIVTHGKFQSVAKLKSQIINQIRSKEKNQILLKIFIIHNYTKNKHIYLYKVFV